MNYFKNCFHIFILSLVIGIFTNVVNADLFKTNLGISNWSGDTTLKGFKNENTEKFQNYGKKEMTAYEKQNDIKLFSIVENETRYGKTAFYVQAPSEGCYNRQVHDCERNNSEQMKRVEAHYSAFRGGEYWFTVSIKLDDWALNSYEMIITQFHSDVPQYLPMALLRINNSKGLFLEHLSANGFQFVEGGSEECASGAADVLTENKMYCPKLHDIYQILKPREIEKDVWYDFVYNLNFNKDTEKEYIKVWLNGELVVNNQGSGKTLWWPTMPGIQEEENRITFDFGIYGTKRDNAFHSAYFDEVNKSNECESLNLERLGYKCNNLISQIQTTKPSWHDSPDL